MGRIPSRLAAQARVENREDMYICEVIKKRRGIEGRLIFTLKRMQRCKERKRTWSPQASTGLLFIIFLFFFSEEMPETSLADYYFSSPSSIQDSSITKNIFDIIVLYISLFPV
jgi:hypothetical protein